MVIHDKDKLSSIVISQFMYALNVPRNALMSSVSMLIVTVFPVTARVVLVFL